MIFNPLLKVIVAGCLSLTTPPECKAQVAAWYQQYAPQYQNAYRLAPQHQSHQAGSNEKKTKIKQTGTSRWMTNFNAAWTRAVKEGKPLVALFVHHGCPECDRMDATLAQPGALNTLDSAIKARIEFTENPETVRRLSVKYTPTFLVLSPAHNGEVYREVGALSVDRLRQLKPSIDSLVTGPSNDSDKRQGNALLPEAKTKSQLYTAAKSPNLAAL